GTWTAAPFSSAARTRDARWTATATPAAGGGPAPGAAAARPSSTPDTTRCSSRAVAATSPHSIDRRVGAERRFTLAVDVVTLTTKADDIAVLLESEIVSGLIVPGTVLRQEPLSERLSRSRPPIREALSRLAALGLVSFEPNRGVRVRPVSRGELRQAFL